METLRKNIIAREIRITLLCMFCDILPKDIINIIMRFAGFRKEKSKNISFGNQIKKIMMITAKECSISSGAIKIFDEFINVIISKMMSKSVTVTEHMRQCTINSRTIQSVVRLLTSDMYQRILVSEGTKMVTKYNAATCGGDEEKWKGKRKNISRTIGAIIGPARVEKIMRLNLPDSTDLWRKFRISKGAIIYLTAVINQITFDIIELSIETTESINTDTIINTVKNNSDLKSLCYELFI